MFGTGSYATIWKVENKGNYDVCQLSTQKKNKETWVYELASGEERWFAEHFVSNQHKKISTYGTKVLRKNMEHDLYLYDLKTGECFEADSPCKNARLV